VAKLKRKILATLGFEPGAFAMVVRWTNHYAISADRILSVILIQCKILNSSLMNSSYRGDTLKNKIIKMLETSHLSCATPSYNLKKELP
jgi:hypothetical protein